LSQPPSLASYPGVIDTFFVQRVALGDHAAFETLMRQHNRRLFRVARVILKDDSEAEAALQEAYVAAYSTLKTFRDDSNLATWLTQILVSESFRRLDRQKRDRVVIPFSNANHHPLKPKQAAIISEDGTSSEDATLRAEMRALLEGKIDELPIALRIVFVMRELEEMTVEQTAECLGISEATVRSRLSRGKSLFRTFLQREIDFVLRDVFAFDRDRCERTVEAVLQRISKDANHT
jgi:RNA polymerase sigma-70 factor (ECF subfamily)